MTKSYANFFSDSLFRQSRQVQFHMQLLAGILKFTTYRNTQFLQNGDGNYRIDRMILM